MPSNAVLALLASCCDAKSAMPALANVHLTADAATATDLYTWVTWHEAPGAPALLTHWHGVPGAWLRDIARFCGKGKASPTFDVAGEPARVRATFKGGKRLTCYGIPGADMPRMPAFPHEAPEVQLNPADFAKGGAVWQVLPFVSSDETRPHVNSVLFHKEAVATNGHALAHVPLAGPFPSPCLVSLDAIEKLLRVATTESYDSLTLRVSNPRAVFQAKRSGVVIWTVDIKLVDAAFPPYEQVLAATEHPHASVLLDLAELRALVAPFHGDYRLALFPGGGMVACDKPGDGIATSLPVYTDETPIVVLLSRTVQDALQGSPKTGVVCVTATAPWPVPQDEAGGGAVLFGENMILMPAKESMWTGVREAMREAFGLDPPPSRKAPDVAALREWLTEEHHVTEAIGKVPGAEHVRRFLRASRPNDAPPMPHCLGDLFAAGFIHRDAVGGWVLLTQPKPVVHYVEDPMPKNKPAPPAAPAAASPKPAKKPRKAPAPLPVVSPDPSPDAATMNDAVATTQDGAPVAYVAPTAGTVTPIPTPAPSAPASGTRAAVPRREVFTVGSDGLRTVVRLVELADKLGAAVVDMRSQPPGGAWGPKALGAALGAARYHVTPAGESPAALLATLPPGRVILLGKASAPGDSDARLNIGERHADTLMVFHLFAEDRTGPIEDVACIEHAELVKNPVEPDAMCIDAWFVTPSAPTAANG